MKEISNPKQKAVANLETLHKIFMVSDEHHPKLKQIEEHISNNLMDFLQEYITKKGKNYKQLEKDFSETQIPDEPIFVTEQVNFLMEKLVSQSVHTASPKFIGHMTSALPAFMFPLSKIMVALNQNVVKTETSKAFTPLERQVLGMLHRLIYGYEKKFYQENLHDPSKALGVFCSGGTVANITALWIARNQLLGPSGNFQGIMKEGFFRAMKHYGHEGIAILVSKRGHYSLSKAADLLGVGKDHLISIETDERNKIRMPLLREACKRLRGEGVKILSLVGIAGTTETGNIDPLEKMGDLAQEFQCHFHVDAAWGGPTLFSNQHRDLLRGIHLADSVTIDGHKQLYVPMGVGIGIFKDPQMISSIEHHAQYIIRKDSRDLGKHSLEGSRPGMAMLVHSGLKIMGRQGYELLINHGIGLAKKFAQLIQSCDDFELVSEPELNILTYRYVPLEIQKFLQKSQKVKESQGIKKNQRGLEERVQLIQERLNEITKRIQEAQREKGKTFVSRTQLAPHCYQQFPIFVFRVVLANPLTTDSVFEEVLEEQRELARNEELHPFFQEIQEAITSSLPIKNARG